MQSRPQQASYDQQVGELCPSCICARHNDVLLVVLSQADQ